jgi:hypothetical protein
MSDGKKRQSGSKSAFDKVIERLTGRMVKTTALIAAAGALVVAVKTHVGNLSNVWPWGNRVTPASCVSVMAAPGPERIKASEWDGMKMHLYGRNDCDRPIGIYVTYVRDTRPQRLFALRAPHGSEPECRGLSPELEPGCWYRKKPLSVGKGEWSWDVPSPPLELLSNPGPSERIFIDWSVREYDAPTNPPLWSESRVIVVENEVVAGK